MTVFIYLSIIYAEVQNDVNIPIHYHLLKSQILQCRLSKYAKIGILWKFIWGLRASPLSSFHRILDLNRNQMSEWCLFLVMSTEFSFPSSSRLKMWTVQHTLPSHLVSFIWHFEVESTQEDVQLYNVALNSPGFAFLPVAPITRINSCTPASPVLQPFICKLVSAIRK